MIDGKLPDVSLARWDQPMLPSPALARYHRKPLRLVATRGGHRSSLRLESLTSRSRMTNLGVILLASCFAISLLLNLRYWAPQYFFYSNHQSAQLQFATVDRPSTRNNLDHLIVVPCHAIWRGTDSWLEDKDWMLESYQQGAGRVHAFYEHITRRYMIISALTSQLTLPFKFASAELAKEDPHSLLIFSGYVLGLTSSYLRSSLTCLKEDRPKLSLLRRRQNHIYD